jgi:Fe-S-cluster containining protein
MTKKGLRFECTGCGKCCTNHGEYAHVYLDDEETVAIAKHLGLSTRVFKRRYTFVDEDHWRQLSFEAKRCVFLGEDNGCRIYPVRPTQCGTFPFWRELGMDGTWTQEVRSMCEGTGQGRLYSPAEIEVHMVEMEESDQD